MQERSPNASAVVAAVAFHVVDLLDAGAVALALAAVQPQSVAHLTAIAFVEHGDVKSMYRVNILGTWNLLIKLASDAVSPKAVLVVSSPKVYGNEVGGLMDEDLRPAPANDYAVSKLAMEAMTPDPATYFGPAVKLNQTRTVHQLFHGEDRQSRATPSTGAQT